MNEKTLLASGSPITQRIDAVKALLAFKKVASDPLPQEVSLDGGRLVLVLSNKKDAYYTVTAKGCSCPAATYHPGTRCKHSKKYFPQPEQEANLRDGLPGWPGGLHGPVEVI
ncbi:MAG: hypothetical protein M0Q47_12190 [Methanothrix sp.]|jgi:hypothetical protein|uniref:hypothetical protein n=1 Tax=Methanothrix sp. TaxID=90426 RepID=UPI0025DB1ED3|nr:hypothetical protein [Methanothrix sp.]MCK9407154.1 hypothetical protein [Methanothrix sp.]